MLDSSVDMVVVISVSEVRWCRDLAASRRVIDVLECGPARSKLLMSASQLISRQQVPIPA